MSAALWMTLIADSALSAADATELFDGCGAGDV